MDDFSALPMYTTFLRCYGDIDMEDVILGGRKW